jgi:hypothetical protein
MHTAAATYVAKLLMRACVLAWLHARVGACVVDTVYQLIYTSAQIRAWRIEFSYRYIRDYYARLK